MSTPRSPTPSIPATPGSGQKDVASHDFGGRVVTIVVGPKCEEFSVHANRLAKTAFFKQHGNPAPRPQLKITIGRPTQDGTTLPAWGSDGVKDEGTGSEDTMGADMMVDGNNTISVDYQIEEKDSLAPKAFRIFVEALYNEEPAEILDRETLRIALKAYKFARIYNAFVLQNRIVERFREHYITHKIKFDELLWVIKMFGDDANSTPLTRYLFEQIAHDISTRGFEAFSRDNGYLKFYLIEQQRQTRFALFAILARLSHDRRVPDPAEGRNEWRVVERGPTAGAWTPEPLSAD